MFNDYEELLEDLEDYLGIQKYQGDLIIEEGSTTLEWAIYDYLSHTLSEGSTLKRMFFSAPALTNYAYQAPCSKTNSFENVMFDYLLFALRVSILDGQMANATSRQVREPLPA